MRLGIGLGLMAGVRRVGTIGPTITLSGSSVAENAAIGTAVGTLSVANGTGPYTFGEVSDPSNKFTVNATTGVVTLSAALDFETAQSHSITVSASNGVDADLERTFTVFVTDVDEGAVPADVPGYVYLLDPDGAYLLDGDGAYLLEAA